jgi:hypothetical protein
MLVEADWGGGMKRLDPGADVLRNVNVNDISSLVVNDPGSIFANVNVFHLDSAVIGGVSGYDTHRTGLEGIADGDRIGGELGVLVAGGYEWKTGGGLSFGPTASFQYTLITGFDSFSETGSLAPLSYAGQDVESIRTAFGMRASYEWNIGSIRCVPENAKT